jgi:hypothetical protein
MCVLKKNKYVYLSLVQLLVGMACKKLSVTIADAYFLKSSRVL